MHSPSSPATKSQSQRYGQSAPGAQNSSTFSVPGTQHSSARASSPAPSHPPGPARFTEVQSSTDLRNDPLAWQQQHQQTHAHPRSSPSQGSGAPLAAPSTSRPAHFHRFQGMVSATGGGLEESSNTRMSFQHPSSLREENRPLPLTVEVPSQSPQRRLTDSSSRAMDRSKATKRRRAPQACMRCRGQKLRCDGQQPCGRCITQGAECKFDGGQRGAAPGTVIDSHAPLQRQITGGPMGVASSSAIGFREGVVSSMPSSPSGGPLPLDQGYFPGSGSPSSALSQSPPQPMHPPPTAALSSFTTGAVGQPHFVAHGRAATTIPPLSQSQGPSRSTHFSGHYGSVAPSIPAESPSSTTSHPRFQPGVSSSGPSPWQDRQAGRMGPPPPNQQISGYPPPSTISQSQSWPNVATVGSSVGTSRPHLAPLGGMTNPASTPFEVEILARLTRVENALQDLSQDVHGILASMSSQPRPSRQDPSFSVSPPSTMIHSAERLVGGERIGHGTLSHPQTSMQPSPRPRHDTVHSDPRSIGRMPQATPSHMQSAGPSILRGLSPAPSLLRGGHVRPQTSGSGSEERVQIPPRTSSTMFGSRGSPVFTPGQQQQQQAGESRMVVQGTHYSEDYPRSALPVGLESVPERPSSWSGQREERAGERDSGGQIRDHSDRGSAVSKPRTPPELPSASAVDAWRSGSAVRGRQRATTDVGPVGSPNTSFNQAQLAPVRVMHHLSQQQQGQQQQQRQQLHQHQQQHEEHSHQLQHVRPSEDRPLHGDDGDRGVKRRRLSEESDRG
ncbi:hypothetical protein CF326_g6972 [Tilletia indica]|nr:hypothetical protein CF326_g6972 [Tilletia indica]